MKKSELITGIILTLAGAAALAAAFLTETSFDGIFWGIAGAGLCLGIGKVISWFHWSSPAQTDKLKELQENKEIAQHDELNRIIMDRAGRIAYNFSLLLIVCTMLILTVLYAAGIAEKHFFTILILAGLLVLQIIAGFAAFAHIRKKY